MPASKSAQVESSYTSVVLRALVAADDFCSVSTLSVVTKIKKCVVLPTLKHLRKHHAADSVESDGRLYWFATPDLDTRLFTQEEHRREDEPRRNNLQHTKPLRKRKPAAQSLNLK